ncbi:MAG: glycosyltransferase 87 family protein, partial [Acidobacteriota bacterium]|nr:glycosyltransferase 87 family protein [Acidobacteriota bacterium]
IEWFIKVALCQSLIYLLAVWIIFHARSSRSTLVLAIVFAALLRLSILFAPPYLSDDIYRYVWDGRVQATGVNPYRYIPADEALAPLRDQTIYPKINRRDYAHTIYPPGAQIIYFLATRVSEHVTWMKVVMLGFEAVAIWALLQLLASFNLPRQRVLIYAWHPLLVWEIAGSGHVEAAAIAFVVLALLARRRRWDAIAGAALAGATLIKLFPVILLPALCRRWGWKMPVAFGLTMIIAYLPYLSVGVKGVLGFLPGYAQEEGLQNGTQFYLLSLARRTLGEARVPSVGYLIFAILALGLIALWSFWKREQNDGSYIARAFVIAATFVVLLSPNYAWYFAWLVAFTCLLPRLPFFYLTTACFVLYKLWLPPGRDQLLLLDTIIYLPFAMLGLIALFQRARRDRARGRLRHLLEREPV